MSSPRYARNGDVELAWTEEGAGPTVVLIQGLGYGRWGWDPIVSGLTERFRVLRFDNRGIGDSSIPGGPYTTDAMAADAAAVIEAASEDRCHVVGTSLGGMIAQELVLGWPQLVDRLVLSSTTPGGPNAHPMPEVTVRLIEESATLEPTEALRRFVANALSPQAPTELVNQVLALRLANPPDPTGWHAQAAAGATHDAFERLDQISAPTLVIHGTADTVVDPANGPLLARRIPDARLELVEGGGHLFFWEQPEPTVRTLADFLGSGS